MLSDSREEVYKREPHLGTRRVGWNVCPWRGDPVHIHDPTGLATQAVVNGVTLKVEFQSEVHSKNG